MVNVPHSKHFTGHFTKKKSYQPLDVCVPFRYQNNLYGDATRGCNHRGNLHDASARPISHNRQRLGDFVIEAPRRSPVGCSDATNWVVKKAKEVIMMAAKKKAAKKTAAKKKPAAKKKK